MDALKRQIKYQLLDTKVPFIVFWAVIIFIDMVGYYLNYRFGDHDVHVGVIQFATSSNTTYISIAGGNIGAIIIFFIVYVMLTYYENFPVSICFSTTRKNFYKGTVVTTIILCLGMAIIQGILLKFDVFFIKFLGMKPVSMFLWLNLLQSNIFFIIIVLFLLFILLCSLFNIAGALFYRYGYKVPVITLLIIIFLAIINSGILETGFRRLVVPIFTYTGFPMFFIKTFIASVLLYTLAWLLVKSMSVRNTKTAS